MKILTLKLSILCLVLLFGYQSHSQVTVTINNMSHVTGGNVANNGPIEIGSGSNSRIQFTVDLTKPSNQVVGNGTLQIYIKRTSSSSPQSIDYGPTICNTCWTDFYTFSKDITLQSSSFNTTGGVLYAEFESGSGVKYKSSNWTVTVTDPPITNNTISGNQTIYTGQTPSTLNGSTPNGGSGSFTYKWQKKTTGGWSNISGATSKNFSPGALTTTTKYQRIVSSGNASGSTSNRVTITVNNIPPITNNSISFNGNNLFSGSTPRGGNGTYKYQWECKHSDGNWYPLSGATSKNYSLQSPGWGIDYRRIVSSNGLESISNIVILSAIGNNTIKFNGSDTIIGGTPSGGYGNFTYLWYLSIDGSELEPISRTTKDLVLSSTAVQYLLSINAVFLREVTSGYVSSRSNWENLSGLPLGKSSTVLTKNSNPDLIENMFSYLDTKIISNKKNILKKNS